MSRLPFILIFFLSFSSCTAAQPSGADFYEGLKKRQVQRELNTGAQYAAVACFEKALNAANPAIAAAAAAELMRLRAAGAELSEATMAGIRQKAAGSKTGGSWAPALEALEAADKEKFLALLLSGDSRSLDEAALYALEKWRGDGDAGDPAGDGDAPGSPALAPAEAAAIDARFAASRSRHNEALLFFRIALRDSPDLFFRYPDLLADLGRAFQYAAAGRDGIELFLEWEKKFVNNISDNFFNIIPEGSENIVRFRLLFFAARMAKQRGMAEESIGLFERALPYALQISPEQSDACIWYILDAAPMQYLEKYIDQWSDEAYFFDVLDKLARELILKRQWEDMAAVCAILRGRDGNRPGAGDGNRPGAGDGNRPGISLAKYAWIISRAIDEGLYSPGEAAPLADPAAYRRIAYGAGMGAPGGLYYRSLSAAALGEPFLVLPENAAQAETPRAKPSPRTARTARAAKTAATEAPSPTMEFLLGFFEHNAAAFAPRYIRQWENDLSADELRRLAGALGAAGQYQESIRLVTLYSRGSGPARGGAAEGGYQMSRQDWELLYPRPFKELVEQYAGETGIEPSLLFALIRTESAFDPAAVSRAGAVGLTQLMPATAREMAARISRRGGPDYIPDGEDAAPDLRDPAVNIHIGAVYLAYLEERMEAPLLALLAYNGGMNRVRRWNRASSAPSDIFLETVEYAETRNYGRSVMGAAAMYKELYYLHKEKKTI